MTAVSRCLSGGNAVVDNQTTSCDLMVFGALGNLAKRKLFPALFQLDRAGLLAPDNRILAIARRDMTTEQVRDSLREELEAQVGLEDIDDAVFRQFVQRLLPAGF